jgi:RNA polymerase sigma factor (sigma-70 family)
MAKAQFGAVQQHLRALARTQFHEESSDRELLNRFVAGRDENAFVALLKRHGPMVLHVCRRNQANEQDAEDILQATYLLLARKAASIRKQESVASWLYGVAYRLALGARGQTVRRQARERRAADMDKTSSISQEVWQELQALLHQALQQLPERYRAPILLCYLEGKTQEEAARQLGCPLGTVRSRLARGRDRLKVLLERQGVRLTAIALAAALAENGVSAGLPGALVNATARAAVKYSTGTAAVALVSARTATFLEMGLKNITLTNLKAATAILLAVSALGIGGGAVVAHVSADQQKASAKSPSIDESEGHARDNEEPAGHGQNRIADAAAKGATESASETKVAVRGRVVDADGKPIGAAKLFAPTVNEEEMISPKQVVMESIGVTGPDGRFDCTLHSSGARWQALLIAYAPGYGVDWLDTEKEKPGGEVTLRLTKDLPIAGRIVNTEGKPVPGVSVSIAAIYVPANENLDGYLKGWLKDVGDSLGSPIKRLLVPLDGISKGAMTDQEGRFTLHGAGPERIVHIAIEGGGVARSTPYIITRVAFDPKPYNDVLLKKENDNLRVVNRLLGLYPPRLTFVAEPGKTIEGVVRDAATGKPLAGCQLYSLTGFGEGVNALTDAAGKYRLEGIPKRAQGYTISASPPDQASFLGRNVTVPDTEGFSPMKMDIELARGVVVTGRVTDRQTGKGVMAGIRFAPLPDNKFFGSKPGFDNYRSDRTMGSTGADGRFRLMTIPGRALILAQAHAGEIFQGQHLSPYRQAVPDPDHLALFKHDADEDSWTVATAGGRESLDIENAVKVIDIKEGGETTVELSVDRGATARITVQDPAGKPLTGAWVGGLTDSWPITYRLQEATTTVYALNPAKPRTLAIYHPEKRLGGTIVVRGDEKAPVLARLGPLGKVIGRMRDTDGNPLSDAEISINPRGEPASELDRFAGPTAKPVITDQQGRFALDGVVPGISFYLQIRKGESYFGGKPKIGLRQLKPGESLNLGDLTMEPLR